jgi:cytochrome subunit of sulfide dehydrogenase
MSERSIGRLTASIGAAAFAALLAPLQAQAQAQAIDANAARYMAGTCSNCHGTAGASKGATPSLGGQSKAALTRSMRDFRDGSKKATVMHQIMKGYSDEQIDALADHFSRLPAAR